MICIQCNKEKPESEMKSKTKCIECARKNHRDYIRAYNSKPENNKNRNERRRELSKLEDNKQKKQESDRKYYEKNKEKISKQQKEEYRTNPVKKEKKRDSDKKYYEKIKSDPVKKELRNKNNRESAKKRRQTSKGKELIRKQKQKYNKNNRDKINSYRRNKRKVDEQYRLADNLRSRIRDVIKKQGIQKTWRGEISQKLTMAIINKLGPRPDESFHLDHIIPLSVFDLTKKEHRLLANSPENLRWLPGEENCSKNDFIDWPLIKSNPDLLNIAQIIGLNDFE